MVPPKDLGATTLTIRATGSTDPMSSDGGGLPGLPDGVLRAAGLLDVAAELEAHRGEHLAREVRFSAGGKALEERRAQDRGGRRFFDRRLQRPASFARVGNVTGEVREVGSFGESLRGEVEQPRRDDAAMPPHLR